MNDSKLLYWYSNLINSRSNPSPASLVYSSIFGAYMREPSGAALFGGHGAHVCPSDEGGFWRLFDAAIGALVRSDGRWADRHSLH